MMYVCTYGWEMGENVCVCGAQVMYHIMPVPSDPSLFGLSARGQGGHLG